MAVVGASVSSGSLVKSVRGRIAVVAVELEGAGEHEHHGESQEKLEAHRERYVIIISLVLVNRFIIHAWLLLEEIPNISYEVLCRKGLKKDQQSERAPVELPKGRTLLDLVVTILMMRGSSEEGRCGGH